MSQAKHPQHVDTISDDFTSPEIADHLSLALHHLRAAEAQWPGLVNLPSGDRSGNLGKLVSQLSTPLHKLFDALTPHEGDDAQLQTHKKALAAVFNTLVGAEDHGKDTERFEVELLVRRLERIEAEQKIIAELDRVRTRFADDVLNTGEMVVGPGLQAIEVARTAANKPEFKSLLAPVLDSLGDMTKKARQHQAEARKAAKAKAGEAGTATGGGKG